MITNYSYILVEAFHRIPIITIMCLALFIISLTLIIALVIIILLDNFYRPAIPQYPYNIVFDRLFPFILLTSPTAFVFMLTKDIETISYLQRFNFILLTHIGLIPIFYYWSKLRSWDILNEGGRNYITLDHPLIYKHIAVAIIYPSIWGIYFTLTRYLRLNITIDIFDLISKINTDIIILLLFLLPFALGNSWIKLVSWKLMDLRFWLWSELSKLLYVLHLYLLRYKIYFYIFEKLHKIAFIWGTYVSINPSVYPFVSEYSIFRKILKMLYFKPYLGFLSVLSFVILEILLTAGKLHYSLYVLFAYPIIYTIGYFLSYLYTMPWINDVCRADYFARNWNNPKYPTEFWVFFADPSERYDFNWEFSQEEEKELQELASKYLSKKYSIRPMLPYHLRFRPLCTRIKGTYKTYNGVRWVHTLVRPSYHPLTAWFARTFEERVVLLRSNWAHYQPILNAEKSGNITQNLQKNKAYKNFSDDSTNFRQAVEFNVQTNYLPLIRRDVSLHRYENQHLDTQNQPQPDMIADFRKSDFPDKRIHGLDQKSGKSNLGLSTIFSNMEEKIYLKKIRTFEAQLRYHNDPKSFDSYEIAKAFAKLGSTCSDLHSHQIAWAQHLHLFPSKMIPPMRVPDHFSLENATPEFLSAIQKAEVRVTKISNLLYAKKIPINTNSPPEDLFQDSQLQKLLDEKHEI